MVSLSPQELHAKLSTTTLTLKDVRQALPAAVFELSPWKGWAALFMSYAIILTGETLLVFNSERYGLPLAARVALLAFGWALVGTGMTRIFIIGHECGHRVVRRRRARPVPDRGRLQCDRGAPDCGRADQAGSVAWHAAHRRRSTPN